MTCLPAHLFVLLAQRRSLKSLKLKPVAAPKTLIGHLEAIVEESQRAEESLAQKLQNQVPSRAIAQALRPAQRQAPAEPSPVAASKRYLVVMLSRQRKAERQPRVAERVREQLLLRQAPDSRGAVNTLVVTSAVGSLWLSTKCGLHI